MAICCNVFVVTVTFLVTVMFQWKGVMFVVCVCEDVSGISPMTYIAQTQVVPTRCEFNFA